MRRERRKKLFKDLDELLASSQQPPALRARTSPSFDLDAARASTATAVKAVEDVRIVIARLEGRYRITAPNARPGFRSPSRQPSSYTYATLSPSSPYLTGSTEERAKRSRIHNPTSMSDDAPFARPGLGPPTTDHRWGFDRINKEEEDTLGDMGGVGNDKINTEEETHAPLPRITRPSRVEPSPARDESTIDRLHQGVPTYGLAKKRFSNLLSDEPTLARSPSLGSLMGPLPSGLTRSSSRVSTRGTGSGTVPSLSPSSS
jgi:hypothetical protein